MVRLGIYMCKYLFTGTTTEAVANKRGACAIMCSPYEGLFDNLGLTPCPDGSVCHSTGCGTLCVHAGHVTTG